MESRYLTLMLILGSIAPAYSDFGLSAAAISAASAAISAGTSLVGTTVNGLMKDGYMITCGIEIENWTKFALTDVHVRIGSGVVSVPPIACLPGKKEAMVARKPAHQAKGTHGTVSWLIESNPKRRAVVMWSIPFNYDFYSNAMAVGPTAPNMTKHASGQTWFTQMYYNANSIELKFERKLFRAAITPVKIMDDRFRVVGNMGTGHKAQVKIILRPLHEVDLAPAIRSLMGSKR